MKKDTLLGHAGRDPSQHSGTINTPVFRASTIVFPDLETYRDTLKTSPTVFRNGSIGGEMLRRFTVVFNFPGERIYLKKNSSLKKEFYFNLSGLTIRARGARLRNFEISGVRENSSAAKSDIRKGDKIITVNGMVAADLDLNMINGFLNSKPGRKITLQIQRDGVKVKREFWLENII